jgi:hypothetical protein
MLPLVAALALLAADPAGAAGDLPPLEPVEAGVEDVDPISASLRDLRIDIREPAAFDRPYRVPGRADLFMRISGALHAIFPRSIYASNDGNTVAMIPAGTVFHIGMPDEALLPPAPFEMPAVPPGPRAGAARVELRDVADGGDSTVGAIGATGPGPARSTLGAAVATGSAGPRTVATDAALRSQRAGALVRLAAARYAARGRSSSSSK